MALVHRQIYRIKHGTGSQDIDLGLYLQSLATELARLWPGTHGLRRVGDGGHHHGRRQAGTVALLTAKLAPHACQYAFPDDRPRNVTIRLTQTGESYWLVVRIPGWACRRASIRVLRQTWACGWSTASCRTRRAPFWLATGQYACRMAWNFSSLGHRTWPDSINRPGLAPTAIAA